MEQTTVSAAAEQTGQVELSAFVVADTATVTEEQTDAQSDGSDEPEFEPGETLLKLDLEFTSANIEDCSTGKWYGPSYEHKHYRKLY